MKTIQQVIGEAANIFEKKFGALNNTHVGWSPGRVNLIGEYTDLNNGFVMPMTIDQGIAVLLRPRDDSKITTYTETLQDTAAFSLDTAEASRLPHWARYIFGVSTLSRKQGCELLGFDAVIHSNMSTNGGVSSSAAFCTATAMAIQSAASWTLKPQAMALLCQTVEHQFAGVMCGIMDQMACRLGKPDTAIFIDCASLEATPVPVPSNQAELLVIDSGVSRSLYESEYNTRRIECEEATKAIQALGHAVNDLRSVSDELFQSVEASLPDNLRKRCRHVISENERVLLARQALEASRLDEFGTLMYDSHHSLRVDFEVSVDELDQIVSSAETCSEVFGARLTGAGFGGNAIALIKPGTAEYATQIIAEQFEARFKRKPDIHHVSRPTQAQGYKFNA
ncbi:MAG: galactokinase [Pseudomonadota bacterium]